MRRFIVQCKREVILFLIANFLAAAIGVTLAFILQFITDTAMTGSFQRVPMIIVMMIAYLVGDTFFDFAVGHTGVLLRTKISMLFRNALVRRIQKSSIEEKEEKGDAYYLSLLNNNISEVETEYVNGILIIVFQIFSLIFALVATTSIEPILTVVIILMSVIPLIVPQLLKNKLEKVNRVALEAKSKYLKILNELLEGFQVLKIFGRERNFDQYHDVENENYTRETRYNFKWRRFSMSLSYGMGNLVILGTWGIGLVFTLNGMIEFSQLIALTTLMNMVAGPFQIISERYSNIIAGKAIAADLLRYIDEDEREIRKYKSQEKDIEEIKFENIMVRKDDRLILDNVDFEIEKNQKICIIGGSGSGKSTLLKAIAGTISIQKGHIYLNGKELNGEAIITHPDSLFIEQNTTIFSTSIANNITMFKPDSAERIEDTIDRSGLKEWFQRNGADVKKEIEKSKINLSGGEQKRLDFARALMKEHAQLLLFDEPTSGLDSYHAKNIMNQICGMNDISIVVATHDLTRENMMKFDRIYVIDNGKVVLSGKPEEIIQSSIYKRLKQGESQDV